MDIFMTIMIISSSTFLTSKGWYRLFYKGKSIQMPERCVPVNKCGTHSPLWLAGRHPNRRQGIVTRRVCGHWKKNCCGFKSNPIQVKKCRGNYYVYKFSQPSTCYLAYCAGTKWALYPSRAVHLNLRIFLWQFQIIICSISIVENSCCCVSLFLYVTPNSWTQDLYAYYILLKESIRFGLFQIGDKK